MCVYLLFLSLLRHEFSSNFAPIIKNVATLAKEHMDGQHYYVLLIITDGIITDMPDTTEVSMKESTQNTQLHLKDILCKRKVNV